MIRLVRKYRKSFAAALLLLNMSGGRVYAATDACANTRVFFGPSLGFKMVARSVGCRVTRTPWQKQAPRSLGERPTRFSAADLSTLRGSSRVAPVAVIAGKVLTLAALPRRAHPQTQLALSCELGSAPPLHTRK